MTKYIDREALINYANNHTDRRIDANDIARFPGVDMPISVDGKVCPLLKCKCLCNDCALYVCENCAFAQIAVADLSISGSVDAGLADIAQTLESLESVIVMK